MMENNDNYYITFGAQMGDSASSKAVGPHLVELQQLLYKHCDKIYCEEIDEIAPILRVDGDYGTGNLKAVNNYNLAKKKLYYN